MGIGLFSEEMALSEYKLEKLNEIPVRAYYVWDHSGECDEMICVIAKNIREAKKIGWNYLDIYEYINVRAKWVRDWKGNLPIGIVENKIGLIEGLYNYAEVECDKCGELYWLTEDNVYEDGVFCENCRRS